MTDNNGKESFQYALQTLTYTHMITSVAEEVKQELSEKSGSTDGT